MASTDKLAQRAQAKQVALTSARAELLPLDDEIVARDGLSAEQVAERVRLGLSNNHKQSSSRSLVSILRANLFTLFNAVVGGSFILLLVLGQWKDALFGFAVVSNVLIGIIQEYSSKRSLDRLTLLHQPLARVKRSGVVEEIPVAQIVLDDLLVLKLGDQILADATVLLSNDLEVDESLLTGEAEAVDKVGGNSLLAGSGVVAGNGTARVVRVGPETYASQLTLEARRFSLVNSELRNALRRIVRWITWALIPIMAIVINGQMQAAGGWQHAIESGEWLDAAVGSIASIISMIPQGLVLMTSIAFAVAAVKLARQQVLVQELPAVEGLARVDVICFDKTGTLTEGKIVFDQVHQLTGAVATSALSTATTAAASGLSVDEVLSYFGADPEANSTTQSLTAQFNTLPARRASFSVPFSSLRKWSAFTFDMGASGKAAETWVLGAPEFALKESSPAQKSALKQAAELAASGRRTLVLARSESTPGKETLPAGLLPIALITFREVVRTDAAETLAYFKQQGVSVRIISGDNPQTVAAVAREAGVDLADTGVDSQTLPEEIDALAEILESHHVFGRVTPEQKRNMVLALQSKGHVVAMTGDGVNDALALKMADLGIAMSSGAPATKAVSNLVLLDGKFSSLPSVVAEGRRVIANIERVSRLFLSKTTWAMVLGIVFGIMLWTFPFLPRQLSAVDGYTIGIPAFALALLPNARRYIPGFLKRALSFCIPAGLIIGTAVIVLNMITTSRLALFEPLLSGVSWSMPETQTATSVMLSITGLWVLTALARPLDTLRVAIIAVMYISCVAIFYIPLSTWFFGFVPLSPPQLITVLSVGVIACALLSVVNYVVVRINQRSVGNFH